MKNKGKNNPILKFKIDYSGLNLNITSLFEVFKSYKDKKEYIVYKDKYNYIYLYDILENRKIVSSKNHKRDIIDIRYFINNKNFNEYLTSVDSIKTIIWKINIINNQINLEILHFINSLGYSSHYFMNC